MKKDPTLMKTGTRATELHQNPVSDNQTDPKSPTRRRFLSAAGMTTTATLAVSLSSHTGVPGTRTQAQPLRPISLQRRGVRALEIRTRAALFQLQQAFPFPQNNGDERRYPTRLASYSKALPHDDLGLVDQNAY